MKIYENVHPAAMVDGLNNTITVLQSSLEGSGISLSSICFFDIETTGLAAEVSSLYLIGAGNIIKDLDGSYSFQITQWFADDYNSETDLLQNFATYLQDFSKVYHYNGSTFDIPYLSKKYAKAHLPNPFETIESIDVFKEIRKIKRALSLPSLKLTSVEQFFHFSRNDQFTGKDCIDLYCQFMKNKYYEQAGMGDCLNRLLLHNHDDILGTFLSSQFLGYLLPFQKALSWKISPKEESVVLRTKLPYTMEHLCLPVDQCIMLFIGDTITLQCPLYVGTAYLFYKNYKDYFYFPTEDTAIHKSLAIYSEASHREKATAKNCYTKKEGRFLPLQRNYRNDVEWNTLPLFHSLGKEKAFLIYEEGLDCEFWFMYLQELSK